jgi:predicted nucleic acid-binding protein
VVLVDTSVWVSHLRVEKPALQKLLLEAEVVCHPFILGELACGNIRKRAEVLSLLRALPMAPVVTGEEFLDFVDANRLMGSGIGFVDVHLLASARLARLPLWTQDRNLTAAARRLNLLREDQKPG